MSIIEMIAVAGLVMTVFGTVFGVWKFVDGKIVRVRDDLADHKLHVAEHYATKDGVTEATAMAVSAVNEMGARIDKRLDGVTQRLDRVIEHNNRPHPRST